MRLPNDKNNTSQTGTLYARRFRDGSFGNNRPRYEVRLYRCRADALTDSKPVATYPSHYTRNPQPSDRTVTHNCGTYTLEWPDAAD